METLSTQISTRFSWGIRVSREILGKYFSMQSPLGELTIFLPDVEMDLLTQQETLKAPKGIHNSRYVASNAPSSPNLWGQGTEFTYGPDRKLYLKVADVKQFICQFQTKILGETDHSKSIQTIFSIFENLFLWIEVLTHQDFSHGTGPLSTSQTYEISTLENGSSQNSLLNILGFKERLSGQVFDASKFNAILENQLWNFRPNLPQIILRNARRAFHEEHFSESILIAGTSLELAVVRDCLSRIGTSRDIGKSEETIRTSTLGNIFKWWNQSERTFEEEEICRIVNLRNDAAHGRNPDEVTLAREFYEFCERLVGRLSPKELPE
jgi:hypothetical protein